ncbi:hypothetical protein AB0J72_26680 [Dactylosporangium sp. NPDC049742]|uniref:hypothetical protein n=1 Tax=Dactylosporangium sp. NPDC049742 TaxID=3154737 RepID=UPI003437449B
MAVLRRAPAVAGAVVAAVAASGAAMLAGSGHGAPAGPSLAAQVAPAPPPPGPSAPGTGPPDGSLQGQVYGSPLDGSLGGSVSPSGLATGPFAGAVTAPAPPSPFASGAAWGAVNCAEVRIRFAGGPPTDAGGPLVPFGATTVTRCETPLASTAPAVTGLTPPKVLTTGVDRLTAILNALPAVPADQACLPITLPVQISLVFTFREQQPLAVVVDPTCSALIAGDRARSYTAMNPLPVFDALFSAQPGFTPSARR